MSNPLLEPRPTGRVKADVRGVLAQLGPKSDIGKARRAALPGWIKFFSWFFLLLSAGVPTTLLVSLVTHSPVRFGLFGMHYVGYLSPQAVLLAVIIAGSGTTAYGLLWGRSWGLFAGVLTGWGGLGLCIASLFLNDAPGLHIPLEPFLLVPFLVALSNRKAKWREEAGD
jgi:hypothetical protein